MKKGDLTPFLGEPVRIVWYDAVEPAVGWQTLEELGEAKLSRVVTVAHLTHASAVAVHVASDWNDHGHVAATGVIPLAWIDSVERLVPED